MRILVVEDERKVRTFIRNALEQEGCVVDDVSTFDELLETLRSTSYDAIILDRLLHGKDSVSRITEIRVTQPQAKILVLSALSEVDNRVEGLTEGADDYLGKPFHVAELIARLRAITRRDQAKEPQDSAHVIRYGDLRIDLASQRVFRGDKKIELTGKEFRILCLLARYPGKVYSKSSILDRVWDLNHYPESNVVEVFMANLRSKLDKGFDPPLIHSKRGVGYWFGDA